MKQSVNFSQFCDGFRVGIGRNENFSYQGKRALYDYLEDYEEDTGEGVEFDVIALCCDYTEYKDLKEFQGDYGDKYKSVEDIQGSTQYIPILNNEGKETEGFVIQQF